MLTRSSRNGGQPTNDELTATSNDGTQSESKWLHISLTDIGSTELAALPTPQNWTKVVIESSSDFPRDSDHILQI